MAVPRRFLVVGMQRSGTSMVVRGLCGHPQIAAPAEEVDVALFEGVVGERTARGETRAERTRSLYEVFDHVVATHRDACETLAEVLDALGDAAAARGVLGALERLLPDGDAAALAAKIRRALGIA